MNDVEQPHDFADPPADHGQRGARRVGHAPAFDLEEGKRDGRQDDVMRPALVAAPFEVVEAEFVFELAVLLFDRPAAAGERNQIDPRGGGREIEQIVLPLVVGRAFTEQPPARRAPWWGARATHRTAR